MSTNKMDSGNIMRQVYEPSTESLNVNIVGSGSPTLPSTVRISDGTGYLSSTVGLGYRALDVSIKNIPEIIISHTDDSIRLGDGTNLFTSTTVGPKTGLDVSVLNQISGFATEVTLASIASLLAGSIAVTGPLTNAELRASPVIVSATTLPLPAGSATEAKQDAQITELTAIKTAVQSIDAAIPASLGQQTMANSLSVTLASDQAAISINEPVMTEGSIDGTSGGTKFGFVYNLKQQVLAAHDRTAAYTYADFGTKTERITQVDYTSSTFSGNTIRRTFNYTPSGNSYRMDSEVWTVV